MTAHKPSASTSIAPSFMTSARHHHAALAGSFIFLLITASTAFKIHAGISDSPTHRPYRANDDADYFWTESALQYRYAKIASTGAALPAVDVDAQFPEGLDLEKDMTVFMERLCGRLYHLLSPKLPFHLFALAFLALASSFTILAVYLLARELSGSFFFACAAAASYALSPLSFGRVIGSFEYESFALPLIFLSFTSFCMAARGGSPRQTGAYAGASGVLLVLALLSWHLSSFLSFSFIVLASFYAMTVPPADERAEERLRRSLLIIGTIVAAAGTSLPSLRAKQIVFSPLAAGIYAYWISCGIRRWAGRPKPSIPSGLAYLLLVAGCAGMLYWANPERGMYGHVHHLAMDKLRFLLMKPSDPARLSFEARSLWIEAFNSPQLGTVALYFFPILLFPIGAISIFIYSRLRPLRAEPYRYDSALCIRDLTYLMGAVAFALFLLVDRLSVYLAFFLAAIFAHTLVGIRAKSRTGAMAAIAAVLITHSWTGYNWDKTSFEKAWFRGKGLIAAPRDYNVKPINISELVRWAKLGTSPGDPILAAFYVSPQILADADRPVLMNPKFESVAMRRKYREFMEALYGSEEDLYRFATRYGAKYLVYQPDFITDISPDSSRYIADQLTLNPASAAVKLHFFPEQLKRFDFVYQNGYYRVYAIRGASDRPASRRAPFYNVWYDRKLLGAPGLGAGPSRQLIREIQSRIDQDIKVQKTALDAAESGDIKQGFQTLSEFLPKSVHPAWLMTDMATMLHMAGNASGGLDLLNRAVKLDPNLPYARAQLAVVLASMGRISDSLREAEKAAFLDPLDPDLQALLGDLYSAKGDYERALAAYQTSINLGSAPRSVQDRIDRLRRRLEKRTWK